MVYNREFFWLSNVIFIINAILRNQRCCEVYDSNEKNFSFFILVENSVMAIFHVYYIILILEKIGLNGLVLNPF